MICPHCGRENPPSGSCCKACGAQLDFAQRTPGADYVPHAGSAYIPLNPCAGTSYYVVSPYAVR